MHNQLFFVNEWCVPGTGAGLAVPWHCSMLQPASSHRLFMFFIAFTPHELFITGETEQRTQRERESVNESHSDRTSWAPQRIQMEGGR